MTKVMCETESKRHISIDLNSLENERNAADVLMWQNRVPGSLCLAEACEWRAAPYRNTEADTASDQCRACDGLSWWGKP